MEDGAGLCGYIVATPDVKDYQGKWREEWLPLMKKKYPKPKTENRDEMSASQVRSKSLVCSGSNLDFFFVKKCRPVGFVDIPVFNF